MNFFIKSATKHQLAYRYGARTGNLNFFENRSLNRGLLSLYDVKEEKSFEVFYEKRKILILNLTIHGFRFLYGVKKIFHSIVGSNGMAWVVRV